jgi:LmbE family N-acetylglucosaminyl deacetylase
MNPADLTTIASPVLVIVAHPDDIDFGVSGTVAALVQAGVDVVYCLATSGEAGPPDDMDRDELRRTRESEQQEAAKQVGVSDIRFLGLADGRLEANLALRRDMSRIIRQVRPALIITQSPERRWDRIYASHPDHLAVAEATIAAVYPDARNPHAHPELLADEGLEPHSVAEVWVTGLEPADLFVDISDVIDRKISALSAHASQVGWIDDIRGLLTDWSSEVAKNNGFPDGTLVEAFRRINTA